MSDATRLKSTVYVGGLDPSVNASAVHAAFLPFGEILDITLPAGDDRSQNAQHRGFAYVEFESEADAKAAIDNMDQSMLAGKVLNVAQAKPQKDASAVLGGKTAVWETEEWIAKHEVDQGEAEVVERKREEAVRGSGGDAMGLLEERMVGPKPAES